MFRMMQWHSRVHWSSAEEFGEDSILTVARKTKAKTNKKKYDLTYEKDQAVFILYSLPYNSFKEKKGNHEDKHRNNNSRR